MLTAEALRLFHGGDTSAETKIKMYTMAGEWVAPKDLGQGPEFGTIPRCSWDIEMLLKAQPWVKVLRQPAINEKPERGVHYELLDKDKIFRTLVLNTSSGPIVAIGLDSAGAYSATSITALAQKATLPWNEVPRNTATPVKREPKELAHVSETKIREDRFRHD